MTQVRYYNYKADDKTFDINQWLLGILTPGIYQGFDFSATANMTLTLIHTGSNFKKTLKGLTQSPALGILMTKQGVVITEDASIEINLSSNPGSNPRIDTVVLSHQIVDTAGGIQATYSVLTGTPASNPTAPALANPNYEMKLGEIYIPGGTSQLNAAGVVYTKEPVPHIAGRSDVAEIDKSQTFVATQKFDGISKTIGIASLTSNELNIGNNNILLFAQEAGWEIKTITERTDPHTTLLLIDNPGVIKHGLGVNCPYSRDLVLQGGELVMITQSVVLGFKKIRVEPITPNARLASSSSTLSFTSDADRIALDKKNTVVTLSLDGPAEQLKFMKSVFPGFRILFKTTGSQTIMARHQTATAAPDNYKKIRLPFNEDFPLISNCYYEFVEREDYWELIHHFSRTAFRSFNPVEGDLTYNLSSDTNGTIDLTGRGGNFIKLNHTNGQTYQLVITGFVVDSSWKRGDQLYMELAELPADTTTKGVVFKSNRNGGVGNISVANALANFNLDNPGNTPHLDYLFGDTDMPALLRFLYNGSKFNLVEATRQLGS